MCLAQLGNVADALLFVMNYCRIEIKGKALKEKIMQWQKKRCT
jgi:hypothetical protein